MIICVCQNVSERDIAKAVSAGCKTFNALQEQLEVARCCGTCECAARESFSQAHESQRCKPRRGSLADALSPFAAAI
jgi:bacterioferritin-associated ferredoxin